MGTQGDARGTAAVPGAGGATPLLALLLAACVGIEREFLSGLAWGALLAIIAWPLRMRLSRAAPAVGDRLAAAAITAAVALAVMLPAALAIQQAAREAAGAVAWVRAAERHGIPEPDWLPGLPLVGSLADGWWARSLRDPATASAMLPDARQAMAVAQGAGRLAASNAATFAVALMTLHAAMRHGDALARQARLAAGRAFGPGGVAALGRATASVRSTAASILVIGAAEGAILGAAYAVERVPHPMLLAVASGIAASVPMGTAAVAAAGAAVAASQGNAEGGAAVLAIALALIVAADYWARPRLISAGTSLPFLWAMTSLFGGVGALGVIGLLAGPAIVSAGIGAWGDWATERAEGGDGRRGAG